MIFLKSDIKDPPQKRKEKSFKYLEGESVFTIEHHGKFFILKIKVYHTYRHMVS